MRPVMRVLHASSIYPPCTGDRAAVTSPPPYHRVQCSHAHTARYGTEWAESRRARVPCCLRTVCSRANLHSQTAKRMLYGVKAGTNRPGIRPRVESHHMAGKYRHLGSRDSSSADVGSPSALGREARRPRRLYQRSPPPKPRRHHTSCQ